MSITPFRTVTSREIYGADISGLQDAVNRCERVLELGTATVTNHALTPVSDQATPGLHRRIYEGAIRGWLETPSPVIRRGGTIVPPGEYTLYAAQGAVVFHAQQAAGAAITAAFTHVTDASALTGHTAATAAHGAVVDPTASKLILRDAAGRAQVADGVVSADIATFGQVSAHMETHSGVHGVGTSTVESAVGAQGKVDTHAAIASAGIHGSSVAPLVNTLVHRDGQGRIQLASHTPATSTASGSPGEVCWDTDFIYVCVAENTWRRTPLAAW